MLSNRHQFNVDAFSIVQLDLGHLSNREIDDADQRLHNAIASAPTTSPDMQTVTQMVQPTVKVHAFTAGATTARRTVIIRISPKIFAFITANRYQCQAAVRTASGRQTYSMSREKETMNRSAHSTLFVALTLLLACWTSSAAADDGKLRIICFGAHPDDAEYKSGGAAALWAKQGHHVKLVSVTNGDIGHWQMPAAHWQSGARRSLPKLPSD